MALSSLALAFLLPPVVERLLVERLERAAWSRGVDLRYAHLRWGLTDLELTDVHAVHGRGQLTVRQLTVHIDASALLFGDLVIDHVRMVEPRGELDLRTFESGVHDGGEGRARLESERPWPALPALEIIRPSLTVLDRDGHSLLAARGTVLNYTPNADGRVQGRGTLSVRGWGERDLTLDGWYLAGTADLRVSSADRARNLFDGTVAGLGRVVLGELRVERLADTGAVTVSLDRLSGIRGRWAFEGDRVVLIPEAEKVVVQTRGGRLLARTPTANAPTDGSDTPSPPFDLSVLRPLADAVRLDVEGMRIDLPAGPLVEDVSVSWRDGAFEAWGRLGGGVVEMWSDLPPWSVMPNQVVLQGHQVRLNALAPLLGPTDAPARRRGRTGGRLDFLGVLTADAHALRRPMGGDGARFDAWVSLRDGHVDAPAIAETVVSGVTLDTEVSVVVAPELESATFAGLLASGPLRLNLEGTLTAWDEDPTLDLILKGDPIPCQRAFDAIPKALLGPYGAARLEGIFAPRVRLHWPRWRPWALEMQFRDIFRACRVKALEASDGGRVSVRLGGQWTRQDDVDWLNRGFALRVGEGISSGAEVWVGPGASGYVPLAQLPRYVGAAAYLSEEMGFYHNRPIDRGLITRALRLNLEHDRFVYGGSTVTQQLVKNLFLTRQKTLARKLQEVLIATRITTSVSRERVLELYLNCIEFGPNVYGIGRAAQFYFQKDARTLTPREAVFLAMLKPAPRRGAWMKRRGFTPRMPYWQSRAEEIFSRLIDKGYLTAFEAEAERPYALQWADGVYLGRVASAPQ